MKGTKTRTKSATNNTPSKTFLRFIKITNLVPFDAEIDFVFALCDVDFDFNQRMSFFDEQVAKHNLLRFPKLVRYLSFVAKKHYGGWDSNFEEIKRVRDFTKTLVEIAGKHQNEHQKRDRLTNLFLRMLKHNNVDPPPKFLNSIDYYKNLKDFEISDNVAGKSNLLDTIITGLMTDERKADKIERINLERRLFEIALSSLGLNLDNHLVQISKGNLLDSIEGIDLRRLKKCLVCSKVIWAYRLNAKFCSKKCSNVFHQRLYQAENREIFNTKRRENYQYKKTLKRRKR